MEYKILPFVPAVNPQQEASVQVAEQLEKIIIHNTVQGWEYVRLEGVTTYVKANSGCFGLQSVPGYTTTKQMIVFRRQ